MFKKLIGTLPRLDWKIAVLTVVSTLLLMVNYYYRITDSIYVDRVILYLLVPLFIVLVVFRESPAKYGFSLGDWKAGLVITLCAIGIMAPILWLVVKNSPDMQQYYMVVYSPTLLWITFQDLIGWEFLFRGWLLFGYERKFGPEAIWLQAVPFALAHLSKPGVETLSTIFGGFAFGWIAWRTRSFLYPFLIHWFISSFTILLAAGVIG